MGELVSTINGLLVALKPWPKTDELEKNLHDLLFEIACGAVCECASVDKVLKSLWLLINEAEEDYDDSESYIMI